MVVSNCCGGTNGFNAIANFRAFAKIKIRAFDRFNLSSWNRSVITGRILIRVFRPECGSTQFHYLRRSG